MPPKHSDGYEDRLQQALEQLSLDSTLSIPKAAGCYAVAVRTLHDRKNKRRQNPKQAYLHECLLNPIQEQAVVK